MESANGSSVLAPTTHGFESAPPERDASLDAQPGIHSRGLAKSFGTGETRVHAFRGVDLDIIPGSITLLVGPSGCGKTTLISIVAGLLDPTDGEVSVLEEDLRKLRGARLVTFRGA